MVLETVFVELSETMHSELVVTDGKRDDMRSEEEIRKIWLGDLMGKKRTVEGSTLAAHHGLKIWLF